MLQTILLLIHQVIGNWWGFVILFILTTVMFGVVVPRAKKPIFAKVTTDLPKKVLDEYMMTYNASEAERFFKEIETEGRDAYRTFYRRTDFWFPALVISLLYVSFLSIVFPPGSTLSWLAIVGLAGFPFDLAENINHYRMSRSYPQLTKLSLTVGPLFTLIKWVLSLVLPLVGIIGIIAHFLY